MDILSPALRLLSSSGSSFSRLLLMVSYHQNAEMLDYVPIQLKMEPFSWIATIELAMSGVCQIFWYSTEICCTNILFGNVTLWNVIISWIFSILFFFDNLQSVVLIHFFGKFKNCRCGLYF